jgi:hypothetical protein
MSVSDGLLALLVNLFSNGIGGIELCSMNATARSNSVASALSDAGRTDRD